jgi:hypothetical protein
LVMGSGYWRCMWWWWLAAAVVVTNHQALATVDSRMVERIYCMTLLFYLFIEIFISANTDCWNWNEDQIRLHYWNLVYQRNSCLCNSGVQCIVNHIRLLLWDRDTRSYSYYVEVTVGLRSYCNCSWLVVELTSSRVVVRQSCILMLDGRVRVLLITI